MADDVVATLTSMQEWVEKQRLITVGAVPAIVVSQDSKVHTLEFLGLNPARARGDIPTCDYRDFARMIAALDPLFSSRVYYTPAGRMTCILNDDVVNNDSIGAGWRDWRVDYAPPVDEAWAAWKTRFGENGTWLSQLDFAEFVQERLQDFIEPSGASMLELAQRFDVHRSGRFVSATRLDNGSSELRVESENKPVGVITVPSQVKLGMRVFEDMDAYEVHADFRYRIDKENALRCMLKIVNRRLIEQRAVADLAEKTKALLPKTAFYRVTSAPEKTGRPG